MIKFIKLKLFWFKKVFVLGKEEYLKKMREIIGFRMVNGNN